MSVGSITATEEPLSITNNYTDTTRGSGKRFNEGKLRYDLIPGFALKQLARVLTKGAQKYDERNWEKGMKWGNVVSSLERHLQAFKNSRDYDHESGALHVAHIMCNAMFLTEYYRIFPEGDDRNHFYLRHPKIGLDIDEVLCDWVGAWTDKFNMPLPENWNFSYENKDRFESLAGMDLDEFYLNIPPKIDASEIPFEPHCYITSRSIDTDLTMRWIEKNGFPTVPVHSVGFGESKVDVAKESGIEWFVDDSFKNFVELNRAGICCFLWDAPHNRKYDVGYKRIKTLDEIVDYA